MTRDTSKDRGDVGLRDAAHDFRIHDAYVAFSAEVARLALLAPVALSFVIAFVGDKGDLNKVRSLLAPSARWIEPGLFWIGLAIVLAMAHRYFAIDFMAEYLDLARNDRRRSRWMRITSWASRITIVAAPISLAIGWILLLKGLTTVFK